MTKKALKRPVIFGEVRLSIYIFLTVSSRTGKNVILYIYYM